MTSKECLEEILSMLNYEQIDECDKKSLLRTIKQDLDRLEKIEKELKQTKRNFKNSQTHSKNCYKKLKEKYTRLERAYKNNEVMVRDLNELINRNLELKKVRDNYSDQLNYVWNIVNSLKDENTKLKQAIKILMRFKFTLHHTNCNRTGYEMYTDSLLEYEPLTKEEYDLLKEVLESVGDSDE